MRALVIGADGFAGRWLLRQLAESGDSVVAVVGPRFRPPLDGAEDVEQLDVRNASSLIRVVGEARPDAVFNLAGISKPEERDELGEAIGVSVIGSMNVLLACAELAPPPRLLFVSTGYVYRGGPEPLPESAAVEPRAPYAAAKLAAERALVTLSPAAGVEVVIARPFNHIGPGQAESFLLPSLARQVAAAIGGEAPAKIRVADASVVRDFTDVRDVVRAYRLLARVGPPGEVYNIASGRGVSVAELARLLGEVAGTAVQVEAVKERAPRDDEPVLMGDARKLHALGWNLSYSLESTLADVLASG